ncbi:helix-turn-helix domain-containing protein [Achromobacter aloeverae]|uniref:Crp/Fnr family transcriptional regulator n=1 Tax=Achromobacter aloeverae TaxID=1750518 RepID=A0A4Q1HCN0_9BURK|nr:helix-turn-helix domain-containing protein [Achromobacter aloeverae]RXN83337.1 Crp/Fnr family transcriptional regulator [Achromobacter aloeverae]
MQPPSASSSSRAPIAIAQSPVLPRRPDDMLRTRGGPRCTSCALQPACLEAESCEQMLADGASLASGWRMIRRGQPLYRTGDVFGHLYAVVSGSLKTVLFHSEGREQICGFPGVGDLLGMDGIDTGRHACDAIALEDTQVCIIPFDMLEQRCRQAAATQHHLLRVMSAEIVREQRFFMLLGRMSADERLASFLVGMSNKLSARGYSASEFHLRMTREDIGNHLGMKLETVSRTLSKFQAQGWISVRQKHVALRDLQALRTLSCQ